jgi:chloramphenicol-sensitive protein RarD
VERIESKRGFLYGTAAYGLWGLLPLYFKALAHVSPLEILAHRIVWSVVLLAGVIALRRRWGDVVRVLSSPRTLGMLLLTTAFIGVNWLVYIYSVSTSQVMQSSLGYFINPLVNVGLGVLVLRERLRRWQVAGLLLAALGVLNLTLLAGQVPWIALTLAISFAFYGLLRKLAPVDGITGLFFETTLLLPIAAGYAIFLQATGQAEFAGASPVTTLLLLLSSLATAVPLILFAGAARRLPLTTLGFLQYLAPTLQFLLAVLAFGEPFSLAQLASFTCIWGAIGLYSVDSVRAYREALRVRAVPAEPPEAEFPESAPAGEFARPCTQSAG